MINSSTLNLEDMLDKNNKEELNASKSTFFEPIKLNIPSFSNIDDSRISSLFGEAEPAHINDFIYEKKLEPKKKSFFDTSKIKGFSVALASVVAVTSVFTGVSYLYNSDGGFVANASPMPMIMEQNIVAKADMIKSQVSSGLIYDDSGVISSYRVKQDDSLMKIAQRLDVNSDVLKSINNISTDAELLKKESIFVPVVQGIIHKISSGETIDAIALKYRTSVEDLIFANKIKNPNFININQALFIPKKENDLRVKNTISKAKKSVSNVNSLTKANVKTSREQLKVHKMGKDQTIDYLSKLYNVSTDKILQANKNIDPTTIQQGQPVIIPMKVVNRNESRNRGIKLSSRSLSITTDLSGQKHLGRFIWPAKGEFSSGYGPRWGRFHQGIDIAADIGTPISAALGGIVTYVGPRWDYGLAVEITHSNGMVTRYAHCSKMFVSVGQVVRAGQKIAAMGVTGRVTGPHLHFEVLVNGIQVNPRNYL